MRSIKACYFIVSHIQFIMVECHQTLSQIVGINYVTVATKRLLNFLRLTSSVYTDGFEIFGPGH